MRKNSNIEIRNSKQIRNDDAQNYIAPNKRDRIERFGFSKFAFYLTAVCFGSSSSL